MLPDAWHIRSLFGLLLLGTPKSLDGTLDTTLGRYGNPSQTQQSNGADAGCNDPRRSQEGFANLGNVIGHNVVQPDPGMCGHVDGHEDTERLVDESIGPGIGDHKDCGGGHGQEGRHGMMDVGGGRTGISVERSRRLGGEGPSLRGGGGGDRRSSSEERCGLRLRYAEHIIGAVGKSKRVVWCGAEGIEVPKCRRELRYLFVLEEPPFLAPQY